MNRQPSTVVPAEWTPCEMVQLTWPHRNSDWASLINEVEACFVALAEAVVRYARLLVVTPCMTETAALLAHLPSERITYAEEQTNDTWARDHGAITRIVNGQLELCDFSFNGWGMKFAACHDNRLTRRLYAKGYFGTRTYVNCLDFVLEGGSIESDGEGTLLTTSECLLSDNRNEWLPREEVEQYLSRRLGFDRFLWLHHGYLAGDDTDSHVDTLARFCDPRTIAYVQCLDRHDVHYDALQRMERELRTFRTREGEPYRLIPLPMAEPALDGDDRLPATYANFLILNGALLVPTYGTPTDDIALTQLQNAFPVHDIVGIDCRVLIRQHGSLHCVTMHYPRGG